MTWHVGRLIDHVHLRVANLEASKRFYRAVTGALGLPAPREGQGFFSIDELFVSPADPGSPVSRVHLAFQAKDQAMVQAFYQAGLAAGGQDNGPPGERAYHPGYYGAFLLDPDGNNIEAVTHGPARRSAPSVTIEAA
jgi:catechol 2,3-dioxygenase-like lactoylglutathione lyase family enzyme